MLLPVELFVVFVLAEVVEVELEEVEVAGAAVDFAAVVDGADVASAEAPFYHV